MVYGASSSSARRPRAPATTATAPAVFRPATSYSGPLVSEDCVSNTSILAGRPLTQMNRRRCFRPTIETNEPARARRQISLWELCAFTALSRTQSTHNRAQHYKPLRSRDRGFQLSVTVLTERTLSRCPLCASEYARSSQRPSQTNEQPNPRSQPHHSDTPGREDLQRQG